MQKSAKEKRPVQIFFETGIIGSVDILATLRSAASLCGPNALPYGNRTKEKSNLEEVYAIRIPDQT